MRILFCIILFPVITFSQVLPPIYNYTSSDYAAENQNWSISQSEDRIIYIANNQGLLAFNGSIWRSYPSPNETNMRSVHCMDNKIFVGCYMEFGYYQKSNTGLLTYTSLSDSIQNKLKEDEEFWNIYSLDNNVFFQSLDAIYVYNYANDQLQKISIDGKITNSFVIDNTYYYHKQKQGIFQIIGGNEVLYNAEEAFIQDEVVNLVNVANKRIAITKHNGLFEISSGTTFTWDNDCNSKLRYESIYDAQKLQDESIVVGTISSGLFHMNSEGALISHYHQANGLANNTILSIFEDFDQNLWLGLDNGIDFIEIQSPYRVFNDKQGILGSIYCYLRMGNFTYLGTNQGLFYTENTTDAFQLVDGTAGQVWSLDTFENTLFCNHHKGSFIIDGINANKINGTQGSWKLKQVPNKPNTLLLGGYKGLYVLEKENQQWILKHKINNFNHSARYFEIIDQRIFVSHEYKGVFKFLVNDALNEAEQINIISDLKSPDSGLTLYQEQLLLYNNEGLFIYNTEKDSFIIHQHLNQIIPQEAYISGKMVPDEDGIWLFGMSNIYQIRPGITAENPSINIIPISHAARKDMVGYENIQKVKTNVYSIGTSEGYLTLNLAKEVDKTPNVFIDQISSSKRFSNRTATRLMPLDQDATFTKRENRIQFFFGSTNFSHLPETMYTYRLKGHYDQWSAWSIDPSVTFENLPAGKYVFELKSKLGTRLSSKEAVYAFTIARPWYISNLMLLLYGLTAIAIGILTDFLYKRHFHRKQQLALQAQEKEMLFAQMQLEKESISDKNQSLQEEFKSKSNELAAATMSIIRKNEVLAKVKKEIQSKITDKRATRSIIDVIDKNINETDDWEMFKTAFDNVDRDFVNKLKTTHPNLTPNDIKLCAYLRLNLSSKEIAPLFNISHRSVEIKRYRLRKKLHLERDKNLVDYIQAF